LKLINPHAIGQPLNIPVNTTATDPKSTQTEEGRSAKGTKQSIAIVIGAWLALIVSIATLCLTLLGYGNDLAYLDATGFRTEELQRTPVDFLLRSWRPLTEFLGPLNEALTLDYQRKFWVGLLWKSWWILLSLPVASALVASLAHYRPWRHINLDLWKSVPRVVRVKTALEPGFGKLKRWQSYRLRRWGMVGWLGGPIIFGIVAIGFVLLHFMASLVIIAIAGLPARGAISGKERAQQQVLAPLGCIGSKSVLGQDPERQARCVRVFRDGHELARGYVVDFGAGRVFLYQPCTRSSTSVSLERTVIEQVDSLEFAAPGKNCRAKLDAPKAAARQQTSRHSSL
jgi:hypothetical protein